MPSPGPGETSKAGLRRMRRLAASAPSLGPSQVSLTPSVASLLTAVNSSLTTAIHPPTGQIIYPAGPSRSGHLVASLLGSTPPRPLPTPSVLPPSRDIAISPDGRWISLFHPNPQDDSGTLAIYPNAILSPLATPNNVVPASTLSLAFPPLSMVHLYQPRAHVDHTKAASLGPHPPPSYNPTHGPAIIILTASSILLVHPLQILSPPNLDGENFAADSHATQVGMDRQMNVIRCPLNTGWHTTYGDVPWVDNGYTIQNGWVALVTDKPGVWIATEREREVGVIRADVGTDTAGRWYLRVVPMPPLPHPNALSSDEEDNETMTLDGSTVASTEIQGAAFVPLPDAFRAKALPVFPEHAQTYQSMQFVGIVIIYQDHMTSGECRARMVLCGFERREMKLAEACAEISGNQPKDITPPWRCFTFRKSIHTVLAPVGTTFLGLVPLPGYSPNTMALAVISTPDGASLTHVNLVSDIESGEEGEWSALRGERVELGDLPGGLDSLVVSPGVAGKGRGLVGLKNGTGLTLVVAPTISGPEKEIGQNVLNLAERTATRIISAIKDKIDWSDAVRAVFGSIKAAEEATVLNDILRVAWEKLKAEPALDEITETLRMQVVFFLSRDVARRDFAAEMLKLREASGLLNASAKVKHGKIEFDLDCVWPLVSVVEWVYSVFSSVIRDVVNERAKLDWMDDGQVDDTPSLRVLFVLNPLLRQFILRLLAQIHTFTSFVMTLNRPIAQTETRYLPLGVSRDPRATALARDRVEGMGKGYGVELGLWGKALESLHRSNNVSDDETITSFLELNPLILATHLTSTLESLPNPSSLFTAEPPDTDTCDAITFTPVKSGRVRCSRCEWGTVSLGMSNRMGERGGVGGPGGGGVGGDSAWSRWRKVREMGCGCGGVWTRSG